jgi:hypothetical protein
VGICTSLRTHLSFFSKKKVNKRITYFPTFICHKLLIEMSSDYLSTCAQVVDPEVRGDAVVGLYVHLYGVSGTGVVEAVAAEYC